MPACQEIRFSPENQVIIFWSSVFRLLLHHSGIMTLRSFMKLLTSVFDIEFSSQLHYKVLTRKTFLESVFFFTIYMVCEHMAAQPEFLLRTLWCSFPTTLPTQMVHACSCVCVCVCMVCGTVLSRSYWPTHIHARTLSYLPVLCMMSW